MNHWHARAGLALVIGAAAAATVLADGAGAAKPAPIAPEKTCLWQLARGKGAELNCDHATWLTDEERTDLAGLTRGYIKDASCLVSVKIDRRLVDEALTAQDFEFRSPPQKVVCHVETSGAVVPISGTFAPRVVFKGGQAVEASPGLGDVKGVNSYLAAPVVAYVNYAPGIGKAMVEMINSYRSRHASAQ